VVLVKYLCEVGELEENVSKIQNLNIFGDEESLSLSWTFSTK